MISSYEVTDAITFPVLKHIIQLDVTLAKKYRWTFFLGACFALEVWSW